MNIEFIEKIFAPQIHFQGANEINKFSRYFIDLYKIKLFKPGLDLILTKIRQKDLNFEVHIIKDWDTNLGCYLTEQSRVFNKVTGIFSKKVKKTIILKSFLHNVMAHEMAHAIEFESELDLQKDGFRKAVGLDMKGRKADLITLRAEIKRLMVDALKSYPQNQFLSELFARYFELLSMTRDVLDKGDFTCQNVTGFFENVTNFIEKIVNPALESQIDDDIAFETKKITQKIDSSESKTRFQDNVGGFFKYQGEGGKKSWSKNVKSNSQYQEAWKKHKEIEDKKD